MPPDASRPGLPASYGVHRGSDGLLPWSWADDRLAAARNYWLATTGPGGRPHVTPIWGVWRAAALYFGTDATSRKGRNLARSPDAVLHLESGDEAVIATGTVSAADDPAVVAEVVAAYRAKYGLGDDFGLDRCLVFRPSAVLGWREADFPVTATRWEL